MPTRHDRRRERTRAAILDAAERAFAHDGFAATRIDAIAEEADVAVGSIYGHFGNKVGLWSALAERALERFDSYIEQAYQDEWTPLEQLVASGDAYLRFHAEHPGSFRFLALDGSGAGLGGADRELQERIAERMQGILQRLEGKVVAAIESGEARQGDARLMVRFLWAAWNATTALTLRDDGLALTDAEVDAALQQARVMVLEGLTAPSARGPDGLSTRRLVQVESPPDA